MNQDGLLNQASLYYILEGVTRPSFRNLARGGGGGGQKLKVGDFGG